MSSIEPCLHVRTRRGWASSSAGECIPHLGERGGERGMRAVVRVVVGLAVELDLPALGPRPDAHNRVFLVVPDGYLVALERHQLQERNVVRELVLDVEHYLEDLAHEPSRSKLGPLAPR